MATRHAARLTDVVTKPTPVPLDRSQPRHLLVQPNDVRRVITRFEPENVRANQPLLDLLASYAGEKDATPAQTSLSWMLHTYDFPVPVPGPRKLGRG